MTQILLNTLDIALKAGSILGGAFFLYRWNWEQRWKRTQHGLDVFRKFNENSSVKSACEMLDWSKKFKLRIDEFGNEDWVVVNPIVLQNSFRTHTNENPFNPTEAHIRSIFDAFFYELENINAHIDAGTIDINQSKPHIFYWLKSITGNGPVCSLETSRAIRHFLDVYQYEGVISLVSKYKLNFK